MLSKPAIVSVSCAALAVAVAVWWRAGESPAGVAPSVPKPRAGIVTVAENSHRTAQSYSQEGYVIPAPSDPELADALSPASELDFARRLKAVHARYGIIVGPEQSAALRAFVADPAVPAGLSVSQTRALKNDVLNVLCIQPGEEEATAAMLRELYADKTQDPGLRDYALQHLVTLIERAPAIGWDVHWAAVEGDDPNLAATAMLHLVHRIREESSGRGPGVSTPDATTAESARLAVAALRLASDASAKAPARTTALQVCGRLRFTEAGPLAFEIARSERTEVPLRIAAIATLGDLGGDDIIRAYLVTLVTGPERRLRVPAESALRRFPSTNRSVNSPAS